MTVRSIRCGALAAAALALVAARVWLYLAPGRAVRWGSRMGPDCDLTGRGSRIKTFTGRGSRGLFTGRGSRRSFNRTTDYANYSTGRWITRILVSSDLENIGEIRADCGAAENTKEIRVIRALSRIGVIRVRVP